MNGISYRIYYPTESSIALTVHSLDPYCGYQDLSIPQVAIRRSLLQSSDSIYSLRENH